MASQMDPERFFPLSEQVRYISKLRKSACWQVMGRDCRIKFQ